jgi:hypothetical protein
MNPLRRSKEFHWRMCLGRTDSPRLLTAGSATKRVDYRWIPSPRGHFYADPFLFEQENQLWLFFEDYDYEQERGTIKCAVIQPDLSIGTPVTCIDVPYHVSYPHVFRHGGEIFIIPDSSSTSSVELWRAIDFPSRWRLEKTLFRGPLVDTTPLYHAGSWYFFTTFEEPPGNPAFGALFTADTLTGEWSLHPSTPISTDVRYTRSAGPIQALDGRLLRPVQDCSDNYGARIHVEEILKLTAETYEQHRLHSIEPDWEKGLVGVHTVGYCRGIEVLDAVAWVDCRNVRRRLR